MFMKLNPLIVMRRNSDGSGTFFNPDTGERSNVNRTGRCVWEYLEAGGDAAGLGDHIRRLCGGDVPAGMETEIRDYLKSLADQGYLSDWEE